VSVSTSVIELNESHTTFGKSPREQAVIGVLADLGCLGAVQIKNVLRLIPNIDQLGHAYLHPKCEFILGNTRCDGWVVEAASLFCIQLL
jgi:hypothetical protein